MSRKRILSTALGAGVGVFLLWVVFREADWAEAWRNIRGARVGYLVIAVLLLVWVSIARALRYRAVLAPGNRDPIRPYFSAVAIGEFADTLLPLRASLLVRPYMLHRLLRRPMSHALAGAVIDTVASHIGVASFVLFTTLVILPGRGGMAIPPGVLANSDPILVSDLLIHLAGFIITAFVAGLITALFALWFFGRRLADLAGRALAPLAPRASRRARIALRRFSARLHLVRSPRQAVAIAFHTVTGLGLSLVAIHCCVLALHLDVPPHTPLVTLVCIMVATLFIPTAPAAVGQFHASIVVSLVVVAPDTPLPQAHAAAVVAHLVVTGSFILLGLACMLYEGVRWREIDAGPRPDGAR